MDKVTKDDARRLSTDLDEKVLASSMHWTTAVKVWGVATKMFRDACVSKVAHLRVLDASPFEGVPGPTAASGRTSSGFTLTRRSSSWPAPTCRSVGAGCTR